MSAQPKPKSKSPWRAFNPGWLQRGTDTARQNAIVPLHSRLVRK